MRQTRHQQRSRSRHRRSVCHRQDSTAAQAPQSPKSETTKPVATVSPKPKQQLSIDSQIQQTNLSESMILIDNAKNNSNKSSSESLHELEGGWTAVSKSKKKTSEKRAINKLLNYKKIYLFHIYPFIFRIFFF